MKLTTYCTACKKDIIVKSGASTRPDLEREKGEEFNVNCQHCGKIEKKHVNDIRAAPNNLVILVGVGIGVVVTVVLWTFLGAIGTVSGTIPVLVWQQQMNAAKTFNSYLIRRR